MTSAALVVDSSVALKWVIEEDGSDQALALQGRDLIAPALLRIETANVLRTLAARGALGADQAIQLFELLQSAPVTIIDHDDELEARALAIALELAHPVYDCVYLAVAEKAGQRLITADKRLLNRLSSTPWAALGAALGDDSG
jgi:predicted nucleic acid-binding protein